MSPKFSKDFIIRESNQCVYCGLCLPHCPTYRLLKSEADSPRGRIALMNGVAKGRIPLNAKLVEHMDRCLTCRACEAACPNKVVFGRLIDQTRALIVDQSKVGMISKKSKIRLIMEKLFLSRPARLDYLRNLFYLMQKLGIFRWLQQRELFKGNVLFKFMTHLPLVKFPHLPGKDKKHAFNSAWQRAYPAEGKKCGEVGIFLGCVARLTDVETLISSIYVLNRLGYTVYVPNDQTCCGAIHQHSGNLESGAILSEQNQLAFSALKINTVISTASGCGLQLQESLVDNKSDQSAKPHGAGGLQAALRVVDVSQFLAEGKDWSRITIAPLPEKIWVHEPCSLRNSLRAQTFAYELLARIPEAQIVPLKGNDQCCGAAGTYFIDQPEIAKKLLDEKLSTVIGGDARYLVTSNVGCSMFMAEGLDEKKIKVEVMHPVTLLARQMGLEL